MDGYSPAIEQALADIFGALTLNASQLHNPEGEVVGFLIDAEWLSDHRTTVKHSVLPILIAEANNEREDRNPG